MGQRQDYTAVAVVERRELWQGYARATFHSVAVRHVERMALGTPYPAVVERVRSIRKNDALASKCHLIVDATGVGQPVVDMLRAAQLDCQLTAVTITGGEHAHTSPNGWNVPKADLLGGLRVLLEKGELRIAKDLTNAQILMRELMDMQTKGAPHGRHDDLVMALALGCWKARRG